MVNAAECMWLWQLGGQLYHEQHWQTAVPWMLVRWLDYIGLRQTLQSLQPQPDLLLLTFLPRLFAGSRYIF